MSTVAAIIDIINQIQNAGPWGLVAIMAIGFIVLAYRKTIVWGTDLEKLELSCEAERKAMEIRCEAELKAAAEKEATLVALWEKRLQDAATERDRLIRELTDYKDIALHSIRHADKAIAVTGQVVQ